jgi:hypothetical protein
LLAKDGKAVHSRASGVEIAKGDLGMSERSYAPVSRRARRDIRFFRKSLFSLCALMLAVAHGPHFAPPAGAAEAGQTIPDFSGYWARPEPGPQRIFYQPENGPGPVGFAADAGEMRRGIPMMGDHTNPILLPQAAAAVKAQADRFRAGGFVWPAWSLCRHPGVPLALNMAEPVQFLQTDDQITIIYQRGQQVRRIDIDKAHPDSPLVQWNGHSVGHYEGTHTLVVDTIAQDTRSVVDRFGTPKSAAMRVVERYTISADGQSLDVEFTVEDPGMFTTAWSSRVPYEKLPPRVDDGPQEGEFAEINCSENNRNPGGGEFSSPFDDKPDV